MSIKILQIISILLCSINLSFSNNLIEEDSINITVQNIKSGDQINDFEFTLIYSEDSIVTTNKISKKLIESLYNSNHSNIWIKLKTYHINYKFKVHSKLFYALNEFFFQINFDLANEQKCYRLRHTTPSGEGITSISCHNTLDSKEKCKQCNFRTYEFQELQLLNSDYGGRRMLENYIDNYLAIWDEIILMYGGEYKSESHASNIVQVKLKNSTDISFSIIDKNEKLKTAQGKWNLKYDFEILEIRMNENIHFTSFNNEVSLKSCMLSFNNESPNSLILYSYIKQNGKIKKVKLETLTKK